MNGPVNNDAEDRRAKRYLAKVISGGQTGVDRAGLDAAIYAGIPVGGYCPAGRCADDGIIPSKYPLVETASRKYPVRTRMNVEEADGTLILISGSTDRGTELTGSLAKQKRKPLLIINLEAPPVENSVSNWIRMNSIHILNIAGPRESSSPGICMSAFNYLRQLFELLKSENVPHR